MVKGGDALGQQYNTPHSKLLNGVDKSSKIGPFHENNLLRPYVFFYVLDGMEHSDGSSYRNDLELLLT
ncbi:predicted protein [Arabidopsis lyrata subsp. lyrata]|uniref:Predicted protein n=1 Tax=Arabidopsis lyrata subsp. lyrata TaxID=81972 RepID=D7LNF4_ARALL|nr:predicted protein [Arabidopsis lyrata subsp. lyrata]